MKKCREKSRLFLYDTDSLLCNNSVYIGTCKTLSKGEDMGNIYGYVRVSDRNQNEDRQIIAMQQMEVPKHNIYTDKQSGKDFNRPMYRQLMKKVRPDDVIFIKSIDRLGRNYEEILEQWKVITKE